MVEPLVTRPPLRLIVLDTVARSCAGVTVPVLFSAGALTP